MPHPQSGGGRPATRLPFSYGCEGTPGPHAYGAGPGLWGEGRTRGRCSTGAVVRRRYWTNRWIIRRGLPANPPPAFFRTRRNPPTGNCRNIRTR